MSTFVEGLAGFVGHLGIPHQYGTIFAAIVVISFAVTTIDTGVRLQRYIIQEIGQLVGTRRDGTPSSGARGAFHRATRNLTVVTFLAVLVPLGLALAPGGEEGLAFGRLWTLFGTTNQLTAGLALAVIAVYVTQRRRSPLAQLVPLVFLLVMTVWALIENLTDFIAEGDWVLAPLDAIILVLAVWLIVEAYLGLRRAWADRDRAPMPSDDPAGPAER